MTQINKISHPLNPFDPRLKNLCVKYCRDARIAIAWGGFCGADLLNVLFVRLFCA